MKIILIEDEFYTAKDLESCIKELRADFLVLEIIATVKEGIAYFKTHSDYDLIFSDIQLTDGLSFEIFNSAPIQAPVIFCTAFDNYAIDAFKVNGIDYIVKPIRKESIMSAIEKYNRLVRPMRNVSDNLQQLISLFNKNTLAKNQSSILVHLKDKIIPIKIQSVLLFYIQNEQCRIVNSDGNHYSYNETLDEIEKKCGTEFFRANRQFLINRIAISEVVQHFSRKHLLKLKFPIEEEIIISKEKSPALLRWLQEN